jgi:sugar phosphate isomerase/epimerase
VLGCYFNPVQPSDQLLEQQLRRFEQHLRIQHAIGASCVGTETGSIDPSCAYHPDTQEPWVLDRFYHSLERLLTVAEKEHATVAIEAVAKNHTISTIGRVRNMIERFDSPSLGIIFDLANLTPFTGIPEADGSFRATPSAEAQTAFVTAYLSIVKNRLKAIHVKNYRLGNDGIKIGDLPADEGAIDWKTVIPLIETAAPGTPCILEGPFPHADGFMTAL